MKKNKRGRVENTLVSEINITPFVDVVLVLLVIFMITAPGLYNGISLNLPKTTSADHLESSAKFVIVSLTETGELYIGKKKYLFDEVVEIVFDLFKEYKTEDLYLRVDESLPYGKVAHLLSLFKNNNIAKIHLITENEKNG